MAASLTFNPKGLEALTQAALDQIEKTIAVDVAARAARYAPSDTGALGRSIRVSRQARDVQVGSDLEYASEVELGTRVADPQPYLRTALRSTR